MLEEDKICLNCGKTIKGRSDKKFCDDYCRNNFNNRQQTDKTNLIRNINKALSKNRKLLEDQITTQDNMKKTTRSKLLELGFNFKYFTHIYQNQKGQVYYFVYDFGYLLLENDFVLIVKRD